MRNDTYELSTDLAFAFLREWDGGQRKKEGLYFLKHINSYRWKILFNHLLGPGMRDFV